MYFSRSHVIVGVIAFLLGIASLGLIGLGVYQWDINFPFETNLNTILSFGYMTIFGTDRDVFCSVFLITAIIIFILYFLFTGYFFLLGLKRKVGIKILGFLFVSLFSLIVIEIGLYFGLFQAAYNVNKSVSKLDFIWSIPGLAGVGCSLIATVLFIINLGDYATAINRIQKIVNDNIDYEESTKDELRSALAESKYKRKVIKEARKMKYADMTPDQKRAEKIKDRELDKKAKQLEKEEQKKIREQFKAKQEELAREKLEREKAEESKLNAEKRSKKNKNKNKKAEEEEETSTSVVVADGDNVDSDFDKELKGNKKSSKKNKEKEADKKETKEESAPQVDETAVEQPAPIISDDLPQVEPEVSLNNSGAESPVVETSPSGTTTSEMPTEQIISNEATPTIDSATGVTSQQ